jgi:hypothetical protein
LKRILALDLASTTGWAFGPPGSQPHFGHEMFMRGDRAAAYRRFRGWLDTWLAGTPPDLIVFEASVGQFKRGATNIETTKLLIGLCEHLEEWALDRVELREATVSQVRCHFIGANLRAAIAKPKTVERCREMGWMVDTTDEADACALWDYQACFVDPKHGSATTKLFSAPK